jgi:hypothetical protein
VKADYFTKPGDFSFAVSMRHVGSGDQLEKLERLQATLRAEGPFDPARKKPSVLPHDGTHHGREVRRREGRLPQRPAALAARGSAPRNAAVQGESLRA